MYPNPPHFRPFRLGLVLSVHATGHFGKLFLIKKKAATKYSSLSENIRNSPHLLVRVVLVWWISEVDLLMMDQYIGAWALDGQECQLAQGSCLRLTPLSSGIKQQDIIGIIQRGKWIPHFRSKQIAQRRDTRDEKVFRKCLSPFCSFVMRWGFETEPAAREVRWTPERGPKALRRELYSVPWPEWWRERVEGSGTEEEAKKLQSALWPMDL